MSDNSRRRKKAQQGSPKRREENSRTSGDRLEAEEVSVDEVSVDVERLSEILGTDVTPEKAQQILTIMRAEMFVGPLPHPDHLERYRDILGSDDKSIVQMAQDEQSFRHEVVRRELTLNEDVTRRDLSRADRGQWFTFLILYTFVIGTIGLLLLDKQVGSLVTLGGAIATALYNIFGPKLSMPRSTESDGGGSKK